MRLLLDTHALVWWITGNSQLSRRASTAIQQTPEVNYSLVSFWEICLKIRKKNHNLPFQITHLPGLRDEFRKDNFTELPIGPDFCLRAGMLPLHHRDPWDRLIIATALNEDLTIVTKDRLFENYPVDLLW